MLHKLTNANAYFQSESTVITEMHTKKTDLFWDLITLVLKPKFTRDDKLDKIDPTNETIWIFASAVRKQLSLQKVANNENCIWEFKSNCRHFVIIAIVGIRKRYNLDDQLLDAISALSAEAYLSHERSTTLSSYFTVLPRIAPKLLQEQQD